MSVPTVTAPLSNHSTPTPKLLAPAYTISEAVHMPAKGLKCRPGNWQREKEQARLVQQDSSAGIVEEYDDLQRIVMNMRGNAKREHGKSLVSLAEK